MLKGEIALVTGASRGIGAAIACALRAQGADVVGTATTAAGAAKLVDRIQASCEQMPGRLLGEVLDVGEQGSVDALFERLQAEQAVPSILVNNAGITRDGLLARMSQDDWDAVINTNLTAMFRLCKAAARPMMRARKGCIINISSVVGQTGNAGQANYAAAKAGIFGFTRSLARELAGRNIRVNAVAPGFIQTDMTDALPENARESLLTQIPLKRLGSPEDIAQAVAFLASPNAAYITGETLSVNGGMNMA